MSAIKKDDLILACANAYRTASGTSGSVKAGELAGMIAALSAGGGGIAYDMGEIILDSDVRSHNNIPHELGAEPEFILVWTDDLAGVTNEHGNTTNVGFIWLINLTGMQQQLTAAISADGLIVNLIQESNTDTLNISKPNSAAYCPNVVSLTDEFFGLHRTGGSNYWRAGIVYKYFVSGAWWNTGGSANNAE